ncbi:MAG: hypothetical protein QXV69_02335 [Sulfolobaceae archaeon]
MPFQLETQAVSLRCDVCGRLIKEKPLVVKTCCNNKPWTFCSDKCYRQWLSEWLRKQEQKAGMRRKQLL